MEQALLQALHDDPADDTARLALADWLEEHDQPQRAELLRLHVALWRSPSQTLRRKCERQVRALLARGVRPCVPALTNSVGIELALIPPGTFRTGAPRAEGRRFEEAERFEEEGPVHTVTLTRGFYLGVYLVTQQQYRVVMGTNPSASRGRNLDTASFPVENVSWEMAAAFCKKLSARREEKGAGRVYRLPSEAEWEYACRAGTTTPFWFGGGIKPPQANYQGSRLSQPTPVGNYPPNLLGLYDTHGNVWEWTADWYDPAYYRASPAEDPTGPP